MLGYDRGGPTGANAVSGDYVANLFKDRIGQNIGNEDRLPTVYCCAARSALRANNKSVQRRDVGFRKSWRSNSPHVYPVLVEKPN